MVLNPLIMRRSLVSDGIMISHLSYRFSRGGEKDMEIPDLFILQIQHFCPDPWWTSLSFFPVHSQEVQDHPWRVRRFQDSKDKSLTANLRHHANRCFGEDAVKTATNVQDAEGHSSSIFALFARQRQQPVHHSHHSHTNDEVR
jgi:hypothetical protein